MSNPIKHNFIYFSTGFFGEAVLKNLLEQGIVPRYIVTSPDRPVGRHQTIEAGPIKQIAIEREIPFFQPEKLKTEESLDQFKKIITPNTICVVADYGKILPQVLLDIPCRDFINIHPSLLPLFRGPAPLQNTILENHKDTAVTIIKMDEQMDHGPIVAQKEFSIDENIWPCSTLELSDILAKEAASILMETLEKYENNSIEYTEQNHDQATYTKMINKADAQVFPESEHISDIYKKYQAYKLWPEAFYMNKGGKRVKIKKMSPDKIERIVIEGKSESDFMGV
ncbi:methionyl-tRNA formyltransferase [Candidatus Parcubacteria bacterium]|nr:methionyl-tRNA formyltransferase [Candidatus Parcubacteria bacterium]